MVSRRLSLCALVLLTSLLVSVLWALTAEGYMRAFMESAFVQFFC